MMRFLLELQCEEVPVEEQQRFIREVPPLLEKLLDTHRVVHSSVCAETTPRRLVLWCAEMAPTQEPLEEELSGPPESIAFKDGKPTKAALGFAKKVGMELQELHRVERGGRTYLAGWRREAARPTLHVLGGLLPGLIDTIPFRKSMRWGENTFSFVRPLRGILALLGSQEISFSVKGVTSGRETPGHRFEAPALFPLQEASQYEEALRERRVLVRTEERLHRIEQGLRKLEEQTGLTLIPDSGLLVEVALLVEYPYVVLGSFREEYLEVPRQVILSAMRKHQRYFGFERGGALAPNFATVLGTKLRDPAVGVAGNERVLSARLADARFFWDEDKKTPLSSHEEHMKSMVYHRKLGTLFDKIERITELSRRLSAFTLVDEAQAVRAAALCKMDLDSYMVQEFPELQGLMGQKYAELQGEPPLVSQAIADHYQPRHATDRLPREAVGATVAMADRLDTIVGGVAVGLKPTGSSDPFALRRAALGLLKIMLRFEIAIPLDELIAMGAAILPLEVNQKEVKVFLLDRLRTLLLEESERKMVEAVLASGHQIPIRIQAILKALGALSDTPEFAALVRLFKRMNILKKAEVIPSAVDPSLFVHESEHALYDALEQTRERVLKELEGQNYDGALTLLVPLYQVVDTFFDDKKGVRVMDDNEAIRGNRFALLSTLDALFRRVADFKLLAGL